MDNLLSQKIDDEILDFLIDVQTLHRLSQVLQFALIKCSNNGEITLVSENVIDYFGYEMKELIGKNINFLLPDYEKASYIMDDKNINERKKYTIQIQKKDQSYLWAEMHYFFITNRKQMEENNVIYIFRKLPMELEDNLLQNDKLSILGQLAAGIAHEIRNPLTSLKGFIQLMKSDRTFNNDYLRIMESEIDIIDSITKELMVLAKPNPSQSQSHNLIDIFESSLTLIEGKIFQSHVKLVKKYDYDAIMIFCDMQKIKQVILNLLKNAIEAIDGPGMITVKIRKTKKHGIISIKDNGKGMPEEVIENLGKPFFTTKTDGNGLGLMMSYKMIKEQGGTIKVNSKIGKGTEFQILLPLVKQDETIA